MTIEHLALARRVGEFARKHGARIATAESCTGGLIAATCTAIPESSDWFECGFVTYRWSAKTRLLGVAGELLARHGAVSEATVTAMFGGALERCDASHCVAVTGLAGPSGDGTATPVGTVWLACGMRGGDPVVTHLEFAGDRDAVRTEAVRAALEGLLSLLQSP